MPSNAETTNTLQILSFYLYERRRRHRRRFTQPNRAESCYHVSTMQVHSQEAYLGVHFPHLKHCVKGMLPLTLLKSRSR